MTTPSGLDCPHCRRRVVQMGKDGLVKIRTSLLWFRKSDAHATVICRYCGHAVPVEIMLSSGLLKSIPRPRLLLKRGCNRPVTQ